ncbi:hypothetical protein FSP39_022109 [Pinctada imbricata]|uniref:Tyr recombinase domain-containing protein n=1 Tax=Pinctada imbricata TaxID=66713 RepID=A0AA88YMD2_PINIB|nr:hypothetical protein FSP39_022109 [Pinctada imbricata]
MQKHKSRHAQKETQKGQGTSTQKLRAQRTTHQPTGNRCRLQTDADIVNLEDIDERIVSLEKTTESSKNNRKKDNLEETFKEFLAKLPEQRDMSNVSPLDVKRFLVWKDKCGKTSVHEKECKFLGKMGTQKCDCPIRMASSSVVNLVQHLIDIFHRNGFGRSYDEQAKIGNPAASNTVKQYIKCIKEEQAKAHILPRQAKPIFLSKLRRMSQFINNELKRTDLTAHEKYILARDQALFKLQFFAGDRASDVGMTMSQEMKILNDDSGLVFNHTFGKTLRGDGKCNQFVLKRCNDNLICPVQGIENYLQITKSLAITVECGYLFRPLTELGRIINEPLSYSAIYERLREYLSRLGIYEGETPHSFRAGCAIHMLMTKSAQSSDQMKRHIGWSTDMSVKYYSRETLLKDASSVADRLSKSVNSDYVESQYRSFCDWSDLHN